MLNGVEVVVAFSGDASQALSHVATHLEQLGYELEKRESDKLVMKFKGKWFTTDPSKMRHALTVEPRGSDLAFAFGTGLIASHWSDEDRAWAEGRAKDVVAAVREQIAG